MQHLHHGDDEPDDMLPAVMVGGVLSSLADAASLALPLQASAHDMACWRCWACCSWPSPPAGDVAHAC